MHALKILSVVLTIGTMAWVMAGQGEAPVPTGQAMQQAAEKFLGTLPPEQVKQASFGFDDAERLNWHFIPRERKGLPLRDLRGDAIPAAQALLQAGLSKTGYEQALNIMSLEETLYLLEGGERAERRERRNPGKYYLSVFGKPAASGKWGWRVEGHHLSLNFTVENGQVIGSTPEFFGANPAFLDAGPGRAIRVLGTEEDLARELLKLCTPDQKKKALVDTKAPDDLRAAKPGKPTELSVQPDMTEAVGLSAREMSADQKALLGKLLAEYLQNQPADVSGPRKKRLEEAGIDKISFAWWGETERNQRHYYRVQGPTFLIEYNNTQNNANHVHSYWRDLAGDFGIPVKK
jgi:hypothetical protein